MDVGLIWRRINKHTLLSMSFNSKLWVSRKSSNPGKYSFIKIEIASQSFSVRISPLIAFCCKIKYDVDSLRHLSALAVVKYWSFPYLLIIFFPCSILFSFSDIIWQYSSSCLFKAFFSNFIWRRYSKVSRPELQEYPYLSKHTSRQMP